MARSRTARVALIGGLALFGAWSFAPYVVSDVSTQAAVNAPIIRLTAAVDGTVADLPPVGRYFDAPATIRTVVASEDAGNMGQIRAEADLATASLTLTRRLLRELRGEEGRLRTRGSVFAAATSSRIDADFTAADAALQSCVASRAEANAALARAERLAETGFISAAGIDKARSTAAAARSACDADRARLSSLTAVRGAARQGVYLGDSYNDAPYAEQQRDRLLLQRQQLELTEADAEARQQDALRRLLEAGARTRFAAPAGTLVWAIGASPGAAVRAGEPVLDLVDCRRRFVEVALPERKAEAIRPGDTAKVRLIGSTGWQAGRVTRVSGAAARQSDALFAAAKINLASDRSITVEVTLPAPEKAAPERRCEIGRLAEVRFKRLA